MKLHKFKKSQGGDVLGISVVVVIIFLVLAFYLRGIIFEKPESPQREYISSQYANDVIDVIIRTNSADCRGKPGLSFKDLVQDCERDVGSVSRGAGSYCDPNKPATSIRTCPYSKQEISLILDKFLNKEVGVDYYFVIFTGNINEADGEVLKWSEGGLDKYFKIGSIGTPDNPSQCPSSKRSKTYQLPSIGSSAGNIFIKLDICI